MCVVLFAVAAESFANEVSTDEAMTTGDPSNEAVANDAAVQGAVVQDTMIGNKGSAEKAALPLKPIVVRVTGYGVFVPDADANKEKVAAQRLRAIRASRLDAYRNMAERVYGLSVTGASTVQDFALQQDEFATAVDTVLRGARVVSISENQQTGIETVMELMLPGDFRQCLNKVNNFKYGANCLQAMTSHSLLNGAQNQSRNQATSTPVMEKLYYLR